MEALKDLPSTLISSSFSLPLLRFALPGNESLVLHISKVAKKSNVVDSLSNGNFSFIIKYKDRNAISTSDFLTVTT